jgi:hypothetical protein
LPACRSNPKRRERERERLREREARALTAASCPAPVAALPRAKSRGGAGEALSQQRGEVRPPHHRGAQRRVSLPRTGRRVPRRFYATFPEGLGLADFCASALLPFGSPLFDRSLPLLFSLLFDQSVSSFQLECLKCSECTIKDVGLYCLRSDTKACCTALFGAKGVKTSCYPTCSNPAHLVRKVRADSVRSEWGAELAGNAFVHWESLNVASLQGCPDRFGVGIQFNSFDLVRWGEH